MEGLTLGTLPEPDIKRKGGKDMSTVRTALGRRIPLVNLDQGASVPLGFVLQLADKFTPTHIADGLGKGMVFEHVLDRETLDADCLEPCLGGRQRVNDASRELLLVVPTAIPDLGMNASHFETSLRPVLTAFLCACKSALGFCQLLFILAEELRIADVFPRREDHHRFQAKVKPNLLGQGRQRFDVFFYENGNKVASRRVFGDSDRGGFAPLGQGTAPMDGEGCIHLGQCEVGSIPLEGGRGVFGGLVVMAFLEGGILGTAFKEIAKGSIQMSERLLWGNRGHSIEPVVCRLFLEVGEQSRSLVIIDALLLLVVGIRPQTQCPVVDETRTTKRLSQNLFLLIGWIDTVLVGAFLFYASQYSTQVVKSQQAKKDSQISSLTFPQKSAILCLRPIGLKLLLIKQTDRSDDVTPRFIVGA